MARCAKCIFNTIILRSNAGVAIYFQTSAELFTTLRGLFCAFTSIACIRVRVLHRNVKCPCVSARSGSFSSNIAVSRQTRRTSSAILQPCKSLEEFLNTSVTPNKCKTARCPGPQSSTAEQFLCNSYRYRISLSVYVCGTKSSSERGTWVNPRFVSDWTLLYWT